MSADTPVFYRTRRTARPPSRHARTLSTRDHSLDGVHPTTIGYGIVAQEVMTLMAEAGIDVGSAKPTVDFAALLEQDTLINSPPGTLSGALGVISWVDRLRDALAGLRGR